MDPISIVSLIIGIVGFAFAIYRWRQDVVVSQKIATLANGLTRIKYIVGRKKVWDSLGELYGRTRHEIKLMGMGADLSDASVRHDIKLLQEKTKKAVENGFVFRRIQTLRTWVSWLEWLAELKRDAKKGKDRPTVIVSFTSLEPKFVPQVNIKDNDETILVPAEKSPSNTVCFHTKEQDLTKIYIENFYETEATCVGPFSSGFLSALSKNLLEIKKTQFKFFLCHYFRAKKGIGMPTYEIVNETFPLDKALLKEDMKKLDKARISSFCKTAPTTLGADLKYLFSDHFAALKMEGEGLSDELANTIASRIPFLAKNKEFIGNVREFLEDKNVLLASEEMIKYLSQVATTIFNQL